MNIDTNKLALLLRQAGQGGAADMLDGMDATTRSLCEITGYSQRPAMTVGAAGAPNPFSDADDPIVARVISEYLGLCGVAPVRALARRIALAVALKSFAQVRGYFSVNDLALQPSGLVVTGTTATGGATTFKAGFNVAPGESILLRVQNYPLPFNPSCLWGMLAFNGGTDDANYRHILFKAWVGDKNQSGLSLQQDFSEWAPKRWIYGSEFRCGDSCKTIPLRSYTGCTDVDIVGIESALYIQIDNLSTASNSITGQQMVVKIGGFETPCCDSCAIGNKCSGGCGKH
jgi:hypothetical protein